MSESRFPFTKTRLEKLPLPDSGRETYHDTTTPGLIVRVSASGAKSFAWYRKLAGRPVRLTIGSFPQVTVEQARKQCQALSGDVARGADPQAQRAAGRQEPSLGQLWEHWRTWAPNRAKKPKRPRSMQEDTRNWGKHLAHWANRKLSSLTAQHVRAWHAKVGTDHGRIAANRSIALLSAMFNRASDIGYSGLNPCKGIEKFTETARDRFLQGDELPRFFAALAKERDPFPDVFALCLVTGARKGNIMALRWADLNLNSGLWRIPAEVAKANEVMVIPLLPQAVEILRRRREMANGSPWVFPSRGKAGHLVEAKAAWARILKRAGLVDLHVHDLRRTMGSYMAMQGASLLIVGKALGHRSQVSSAIYARLQVDPVRAAMTAGAQLMLTAAQNGTEHKEGPSDAQTQVEN